MLLTILSSFTRIIICAGSKKINKYSVTSASLNWKCCISCFRIQYIKKNTKICLIGSIKPWFSKSTEKSTLSSFPLDVFSKTAIAYRKNTKPQNIKATFPNMPPKAVMLINKANTLINSKLAMLAGYKKNWGIRFQNGTIKLLALICAAFFLQSGQCALFLIESVVMQSLQKCTSQSGQVQRAGMIGWYLQLVVAIHWYEQILRQQHPSFVNQVSLSVSSFLKILFFAVLYWFCDKTPFELSRLRVFISPACRTSSGIFLEVVDKRIWFSICSIKS